MCAAHVPEVPVAVYDIRVSAEWGDPEKMKEIFRKYCKRWAFQLEEGEENGYRHYQCRVSFGVKKRFSTALGWYRREFGDGVGHISVTSGATAMNGFEFYVTKDETRVDGPWTDRDPPPKYVPKRFRDAELREWQLQATAMVEVEPDDRTINVLLEESGNVGKTFFQGERASRDLAIYVPLMNDIKDISRMIMCKMAVKMYDCVLIDMPRALSHACQKAMYAGIEGIKNGYCYDDRYHFKDMWFEPPHVWVFTNVKPDLKLLSSDRWRFWKIRAGRLVDVTNEQTFSPPAFGVPPPPMKLVINTP